VVTPSAPPTLLASRYRLERRLAQGGMAEVWLATDEALSRHVAVKILKPQLASDAVAAERFRREAVAAAGLMHPNIVTVYDAVEYDGRQAVVMQYVPGRSLREVLDAERRLSVAQTIEIGMAVAGALDAAHAAGLVHRDVKPGNILITPDGRVLLTDFGIAKDTSVADDLTSDNVMMGTAKYLAPEQVRGRRLDGRADLYALGLVMYECLAGRVPFHGETDADTALARLQRDPTPLARLRPTLPGGLTSLVHRLLARDPAQRPANGAEVQRVLERLRRESRTSALDPLQPALEPLPSTATAPVPGTPRPEPTPRSRPAPVVARPARAATPPAGVVRPRPPRRLQQRLAPALFVLGGLLIAAAVAGVVLWTAVTSDDEQILATPRPQQEIAIETTPSVVGAPPRELEIDDIDSFDPRGDGEENDDTLGRALDGDPDTAWVTECYQNRYFGAKQGVGVVLELNGPARGVITAVMTGAPWNVDVHVADERFDDLASWGDPITHGSSESSTEASFTLDEDGRYVLLMMREAPRDAACSNDNPFRVGIAELATA
jgi:serine/threonine-protein kinase